ncbi:hypothetical protein BHE90_008319 [Fusarium euwallaceae]|nr:hypothetical protein BHE90_008319 [Fusarium euwallaceae]
MRGSQDVNHGSPHLAGSAPPQHGYPSRHSSSPAHRLFGQTPQECFSPSPRQLTNPTYAEEAYPRPPSRNASQPPAQEPTHDGLSLQHERAQQEWAAATQGWRDAVVALADQQIRLNAADAHLKALGIKPDRDRVLDSQRP